MSEAKTTKTVNETVQTTDTPVASVQSRQPRTVTLTLNTLIIAGLMIVVAALGFIGGTLYERHHGRTGLHFTENGRTMPGFGRGERSLNMQNNMPTPPTNAQQGTTNSTDQSTNTQ